MSRCVWAAAALTLVLCVRAPAIAGTITFKFSTTVDATLIGGGSSESLSVVYSFADDLLNGTGPFGTNSTTSSYGPLDAITVSIGGMSIEGSGGGITLIRTVTEHGYDVRANFSGQSLFDIEPNFFRFVLVDVDALMLPSLALPTSPEFATLADLVQIDLTYFSEPDGIDLSATFRPSSAELTAVPEPSSLLLLGGGLTFVAYRQRRRQAGKHSI